MGEGESTLRVYTHIEHMEVHTLKYGVSLSSSGCLDWKEDHHLNLEVETPAPTHTNHMQHCPCDFSVCLMNTIQYNQDQLI